MSINALRKRLYRAGLRGDDVGHIAREIHVGPGAHAFNTGVLVLGWPLLQLKARYGQRIYRAVTTFVQRKLVLLDEYPLLLRDAGLADFAARCAQRFLKPGATTMQITQSVNDLPRSYGRLFNSEVPHVLEH